MPGKLVIESAASGPAGLLLYGKLRSPVNAQLQSYGHLKVEKRAGFTRKVQGDRDIFLWIQLRNDGNMATMLYDLAVLPTVELLTENAGRIPAPDGFWRIGYRPGPLVAGSNYTPSARRSHCRQTRS